MTNKHFIISIFIAILIHFGLLFYYFSYKNEKEGAIAKGENGLQVGIGIAGSFTDINKKSEDSKQTTKEEKIKEEKKIEKVKEVKKIEVKKEKLVEKIETKEKIIKEEKVKETFVEKLTENSTEKLVEEPTKNRVESVKQGTGIGEKEHTLGGDTGVTQSYLIIVKTKISHAKKYPRSAKKEGVVGTVIVRFVIQTSGKIKDQMLVKSSGDKRLDEEALEMLKRASPFPAIPEDISKEELDLTIPIEFTLKTIKNKFY